MWQLRYPDKDWEETTEELVERCVSSNYHWPYKGVIDDAKENGTIIKTRFKELRYVES